MLTGELRDCGEQLLLVTGQEPAVDVGAGVLRDDVVLVARVEHGDVARVLKGAAHEALCPCLLYTSDAADERSRVDLGGRRIL